MKKQIIKSIKINGNEFLSPNGIKKYLENNDENLDKTNYMIVKIVEKDDFIPFFVKIIKISSEYISSNSEVYMLSYHKMIEFYNGYLTLYRSKDFEVLKEKDLLNNIRMIEIYFKNTLLKKLLKI